jgi:hypothetical protein
MIKHYFIETNKGKEGPFTFEELSKMKLLDSTKVWHEGLDNWVNIYDVEELKPIVVKSPPPTKAENAIKVKEYKLSFFKESLGLYLLFSFFAAIALNIAITWTALQPGADKGPFPVYTSYEKREKPFEKIFLPLFPYSLLFVSLIGIIILGINTATLNTNDSKKSGNKDIDLIVKEVPLKDGSMLQFKTDMGYLGGSLVLINGKIPSDGYYNARDTFRVYYIQNGLVATEYRIDSYMLKNFGILEVYAFFTTASYKNCPVFINGVPAQDGIYKTGLFSKITIKDGVVV